MYEKCVKQVRVVEKMASGAESDADWRTVKRKYDMLVNQKVNAISPDREHVKKLTVKLMSAVSDAQKRGQSHVAYVILLIAKKLVGRAQQLKGTTAEIFPVADIAGIFMFFISVFNYMFSFSISWFI